MAWWARTTSSPAWNRRLLGVVLALGTTGCRSCDERPYTPFQVASSLPASEEAAPSPPPAVASAQGLEASALLLRSSGLPESWEAFGRTLRAPKGTGFAAGLELPQTDGTPARLLAWALPKADGGAAEAGLFVIDEQGRAKARVAKIPDFLPSGPDCELGLASFKRTKSGIASTLAASCKGRLLPGTATGAFLLVSESDPKRPPFLLRSMSGEGQDALEIRIADDTESGTAPAGELTLAIDLAAPSGAHALLPLRFVDKAGGLSRVADAPSADLERLSQELVRLVAKKKERDAALARIDAVRRWVLGVCAEAGAARISAEDGRPFACGSVKASLDRLTEAAIEAYLYKDEHFRAIAEYERADYFLGALAEATKKRLAQRIADKSTLVKAEQRAEAPLRLGLDVPYPFASPLRYGKDGVLYGLSATGQVEPLLQAPKAEPALDAAPPVDPPPSSDAPAPWPLRPKAGDGRLLSALVPSCDRPEAQLTFVGEAGAPAPSVPLAMLAPRPCRGLMGKPLSVEPIQWQGPALLSIAAGGPALSQGSLRAPERALAWGTSLGVEVWSARGHASWRGAALQGLHHCTTYEVEGRVLRVACVRGRSVVELEPAAAAPSP